MSSEDSFDFKKLIKEVGIRKAIEIIKAKEITHSGDYTVEHTNDSHFSTPYIHENQKMNNLMDSVFGIVILSTTLENLYQQNSYPANSPLQKVPYPNSIFDVTELVTIPSNHVKSQVTSSGTSIMPSPEFSSVNR